MITGSTIWLKHQLYWPSTLPFHSWIGEIWKRSFEKVTVRKGDIYIPPESYVLGRAVRTHV